MKFTTSLKSKLITNIIFVLLIQATALFLMQSLSGSPFVWLPIILTTSLVLIVIAIILALRPLKDVLEALDIGVNSFNDKDFSITIDNHKYLEFSLIIETYNKIARIMRDERMSIYQRELLLDTVIQTTPVSMILTSHQGHIVYSNAAAKTLLNQKAPLKGKKFSEFTKKCPLLCLMLPRQNKMGSSPKN